MPYTKAIDQITWDVIESFCQQKMAEGAYLDYKKDFPKKLPNTIAAMANTLGGIILIGVEQDDENKPKLPVRGIKFQRGLSERVTNIIPSNITPPVFPEIQVCPDSSMKQAIVLIRIHQSHQTPHAIAHNTEVYLRTGNRNKPEKLATIDEIEWLKDHRRKSEQLREYLYNRAGDRFSYFCDDKLRQLAKQHNKTLKIKEVYLTISLCPLYPKEPFKTPPELNDVCSTIPDYYTQSSFDSRFPPSNSSRGTIVQDGILLTSAYPDNGYMRFFYAEFNCFGLYFYKQIIAREYDKAENGIDATEIFCRLDEFLDSGISYYQNLGFHGVLNFVVRLEGIQGCALEHYKAGKKPDPRGGFSSSPDSEVYFNEVVLANVLKDEKPHLILKTAQRIGWAFSWDVNKTIIEDYYDKYKKP